MSVAPTRGALGTLGQRVFGHGAIYVTGSALGMVLGLGRIIVLTRILEISLYGELTLMVLAAGLVTMLCRVLIITGTIRSAFRGGDDDADELDEDEGGDGGAVEPASDEQRRAMGTGLIASAGLALVLAGVAAVFGEPISQMLIGIDARTAVFLATALGGLNASYYLVSMVARLERRPAVYVWLQVLHMVAGLAVAVVLIEAGWGLEGAIGGLVVGTLLALIPAVFVSRHRFSLAFDFGQVASLVRLGAPYAGIIGGFWAFRSGDLFMVSRFLDSADVAVYQVASRFGTFAAAIVGGVIMAWGPLMRGSLRGALHREGRVGTAGARMLTYFWLVCTWLTVALVLFQDQAARIAPSDYGDAAPLIPLLGISALTSSTFLAAYRTSLMRSKRNWFIGLALTMPALMVGLSFELIPAHGLEGAALAAIAAPAVAVAVFLLVSQRSDRALELSWRRLGLAGVLAAVWSLGAMRLGVTGESVLPSSIAVAAFPFALILGGALPRAEARELVKLIPWRQDRSVSQGLAALDGRQLELLERLIRAGEPAERVASETGTSEELVLRQLVAALRKAGGVQEPGPVDAEIGTYLLDSQNVNLRDRAGHRLALEKSLEALEVDQLTAVANQVRALRARKWRALRAGR